MICGGGLPAFIPHRAARHCESSGSCAACRGDVAATWPLRRRDCYPAVAATSLPRRCDRRPPVAATSLRLLPRCVCYVAATVAATWPLQPAGGVVLRARGSRRRWGSGPAASTAPLPRSKGRQEAPRPGLPLWMRPSACPVQGPVWRNARYRPATDPLHICGPERCEWPPILIVAAVRPRNPSIRFGTLGSGGGAVLVVPWGPGVGVAAGRSAGSGATSATKGV